MSDVILMEAVTSQNSTYKKKYKCPYCEKRFERQKLPIHIQNEHEDMIPEGYTALRVAFNTINNKTEGHCIICGNVTDWNENKGRYERLCNDPACHEKYKQMAAERTRNIYGTDRLQNDPKYAEDVQRKALAGRRIAGKYKFADGGEIQYLGTYEKKLLEFMDKVMLCKSEDIQAPGPAVNYMLDGVKHVYLPDFYYIPYNLLIEIKDGGDNPNNHPHKEDDMRKTLAKEEAIKKARKYSYVRVTNNNFGQLMQIMAVLKFRIYEDKKWPIMRINEEALLDEGYIINDDDIYYNKDKFNSGKINLCFITGLSGSGKSSMANELQGRKIDYIDLDNIQCAKDHFTIEELDKQSKMISSFFTGVGKSYYVTVDELIENKINTDEYEKNLYKKFVHYAMRYANSHKDRSFVVEGIWLLCNSVHGHPWFSAHEFKDYAFFIKGTSSMISRSRAIKRELTPHKGRTDENYTKMFFGRNIRFFLFGEDNLFKFRKYFSEKMKDEKPSKEDKHLKESEIFDEGKLFEFKNKLMNLYYISEKLDISSLEPRIPKNFMTENGYEDNETPRVCFTPSIEKCLMALSQNVSNKHFYVYSPSKKYDIYSPTKKQVPDVELTKEKWILEKVELTCLGRIKAIDLGPTADGHKYTYGDKNQYEAELFDWDYEWLNKYKLNEGALLESEDASKLDKDHDSKDNKKLSDFDLSKKPYNDEGKSVMLTWHDNDKFVAQVQVDTIPASDGYKWFGSLKVNKNYRSCGLGSQIIDLITSKKYGAGALAVYKDNEIAIHLYKKHGFEISKSRTDKEYYYMYLKKNKYNNIDEITEDMSGTIAAALPASPYPMPAESQKSNYYITQNLQNNVFAYGITKDPLQYTVYGVDPTDKNFYKAYKTNKGKFSKDYLTFKIKDSQTAKELYDELALISSQKDNRIFCKEGTSSDYIYQRLTSGSKIIAEDQLLFDDRFELVNDFETQLNEDCEKLYNYLKADPIDTLAEQVEALENIQSSVDKSINDFNILPESIDNLESLAIWKNSFDAMTYDQRKRSNDESIRLYGKSNLDRYNELYALLMSQVTGDEEGKSIMQEDFSIETSREKLYPVYIVCVGGATLVAKSIRAVTHSDYSHSAISLDTNMQTLYAFNARHNDTGARGFRFEGLDLYLDDYGVDNYNICINVFFAKERVYNVLKQRLDYYVNKRAETKYDYLNLFRILFGKSIEISNDLSFVCSEFVGSVLNFLGVDATNGKPVSLTTPDDLAKSYLNNNRIYNIFKSDYKHFSPNVLKGKISQVRKYATSIIEASYVTESSSDTEIVPHDDWENKLIKVRNAETDGLIIMIDSENGGFIENYTEESIAKLKSKWEALQSLPENKRVLSNQTAFSIFGIDNNTLYSRLLNFYLSKMDVINYTPDDSPQEDSSISDFDKTVSVPYFMTNDMIDSKGSADNITESYRKNMLMSLYKSLDNTDNSERIFNIKEQIISLGWNPEIPYNESMEEKLWSRYIIDENSIIEVDISDDDKLSSYIESSRDALENIPKNLTSEYLKDKIVPVFICLSQGNALHSKGIMWFTDSEWSHASIGFNEKLDTLYSFTAGIENAPNKSHTNGFVIESLKTYQERYPEGKCKVYALFVTPEQRDMMEDTVKWYIDNYENTRYGFKNIFNILLRKATKQSGDKCKMVCSQFVYTILLVANIRMRKNKDSSLISPGDIDELCNDDRFYVVYQGEVMKYNPKKVKDLCYKLLPTLPMEKYGIVSESSNNGGADNSGMNRRFDRLVYISKLIKNN